LKKGIAGCCMVSATDPPVVFSVFLTRAATTSSKYLLSYTHEAEWTLFQTHCLSENLEAPGIEPRTSGSVAGIMEAVIFCYSFLKCLLTNKYVELSCSETNGLLVRVESVCHLGNKIAHYHTHISL
jgi:hypothetical protein